MLAHLAELIFCKNDGGEADGGSGGLFMPQVVIEYFALSSRQYFKHTGQCRKTANIETILKELIGIHMRQISQQVAVVSHGLVFDVIGRSVMTKF
jgi:hypothetical protein